MKLFPRSTGLEIASGQIRSPEKQLKKHKFYLTFFKNRGFFGIYEAKYGYFIESTHVF